MAAILNHKNFRQTQWSPPSWEEAFSIQDDMDIDTPPEEIKVRLGTNLIYIWYTFVHWRVIYKLFFAACLNSKMAAIAHMAYGQVS
jgi:hypothetical protein